LVKKQNLGKKDKDFHPNFVLALPFEPVSVLLYLGATMNKHQIMHHRKQAT